MSKAKNPIPEGAHTITPHLTVKNASQAMEYYKKALGATELNRMPGPDGKIMHAAMKLGDSIFFLNDEMDEGFKAPRAGEAPVVIHLYVPDCDKIYNQAVSAGATATMPLADMFWGDRYGVLTDPYGHTWAVATRKEDLTPKEMEERGRQFMAQQR
ncbi:MAG TPA: VOC family protein [Candidatus Eisenbacteria bacterium]|nr:VOC family protein [Candidatus Eisenbacteria bacterium]